MMKGRATRLVPCTALGCLQLLQRSGICVKGKQVEAPDDRRTNMEPQLVTSKACLLNAGV